MISHRKALVEARVNAVQQAILIYKKYHDYKMCLEELEALKEQFNAVEDECIIVDCICDGDPI